MLKIFTLGMFLFVLAMVPVGPFSALADDCPELIAADCSGGTAWFGLRHDGAVVGQGQTMTLICDSVVLSVEFMFVVNGNPNSGVPSMVADDEIHVVLMDGDGNTLATATTALPSDIFDGWLEFHFPESIVVPAGYYQISSYTTVERQCAFRFAYGDGADCYDGGQRVSSLNGIEGPWFGNSPNDVPFRLHLMGDLVATEGCTWDSIKGLYR